MARKKTTARQEPEASGKGPAARGAVRARARKKEDGTRSAPAAPARSARQGARSVPSPRAAKKHTTVRMYRTGLGDCFLLRLPRDEPDAADPKSRTKLTQEQWMQLIARDIASAAEGRIDLLMITHEHWDHISGFSKEQARAVFESIELGALWLPWTEDMSLEPARQLKAEREADRAALAHAATAMAQRGLAGSSAARLVDKVLGFFGGVNDSKRTGEVMAWIRDDYAGKYGVTPRYLRPGGLETFDGVNSNAARIYVLGPPEDARLIKLLSRAGTTYRMGIDWSRASPCFQALGVHERSTASLTSEALEPDEAKLMSMPFDTHLQIPFNKVRDATPAAVERARARLARKKPLARTGLEAHPLFHDSYLDQANAWRRIDDDWMAPASAFALQLDSKTNNTSLAFALELGPPGDGKVLLFPGDAQLGNWLSWFGPLKISGSDDPIGTTLTWKVGGRVVTAEDLLKRAVFYKVAHHGSHHATPLRRGKKPNGLLLMGSDDGKKEFTAMLPVDEYVARKHAGLGAMPLPELVEELLKRSAGKVSRNDEDANRSRADAPTLTRVEFDADVPRPLAQFAGKTKTSLFIEYDIPWKA
jgi:hypothetical protein